MSSHGEWGWEVECLTLGWGQSRLLDSASMRFSVTQQRALPIMGLSGEGKSTLLYLLASYKQPLSGEVRWLFPDGAQFVWSSSSPLSAADREMLRSQYFGFSFQNSTLFPFLTVRENLLFALHNNSSQTLCRLTRADQTTLIIERIQPFLNASEQGEIGRYLDKFPYQLSGGQKQRFALAKALIHDPCVLFADEPTGQLDVRSRRQVMESLSQWVYGKEDRLIIWVTHHHLSDLELMAVDRALFVSKDAGESIAKLALRDHDWIKRWANEECTDVV